MTRENYLSELVSQLHCRGVDETRIGEIAAEVENHLDECGETPEEAFGPAKKYAEEMAVFAEQDNTPASKDQYHHRTFRATAFDEMDILWWAGQEGWELLDVGPYALFCRRPLSLDKAFHWEFKRRTGTNRSKIVEKMITKNWEPCGHWVVFHYFKRKVETLNYSRNSEEG